MYGQRTLKSSILKTGVDPLSICFFIGHRDAPSSIYPALLEAVERHVAEYGVNEFLVGHYGAFDHMAARAVLEVKKTHPDLSLTTLLPYHPTERNVFLPDGLDGSFYPPDMENVPRRFAIVCANQSALLQCDFLIAFVCRPGNARKLLDYAQALKTVRICRLYHAKTHRLSSSRCVFACY